MDLTPPVSGKTKIIDQNIIQDNSSSIKMESFDSPQAQNVHLVMVIIFKTQSQLINSF